MISCGSLESERSFFEQEWLHPKTLWLAEPCLFLGTGLPMALGRSILFHQNLLLRRRQSSRASRTSFEKSASDSEFVLPSASLRWCSDWPSTSHLEHLAIDRSPYLWIRLSLVKILTHSEFASEIFKNSFRNSSYRGSLWTGAIIRLIISTFFETKVDWLRVRPTNEAWSDKTHFYKGLESLVLFHGGENIEGVVVVVNISWVAALQLRSLQLLISSPNPAAFSVLTKRIKTSPKKTQGWPLPLLWKAAISWQLISIMNSTLQKTVLHCFSLEDVSESPKIDLLTS